MHGPQMDAAQRIIGELEQEFDEDDAAAVVAYLAGYYAGRAEMRSEIDNQLDEDE